MVVQTDAGTAAHSDMPRRIRTHGEMQLFDVIVQYSKMSHIFRVTALQRSKKLLHIDLIWNFWKIYSCTQVTVVKLSASPEATAPVAPRLSRFK